MNRAFISHPVKEFSGSKEPLPALFQRALEASIEAGAFPVDAVLVVAAHPLELAGITGEELAEAGARHLEARGLSTPVEFFSNPGLYEPSAHLAASAAGAALFHEGVRRVVNGEVGRLAVIGLEQMKVTDRATTTRALRSLIHDEEKRVGLTMPALGALLERRLAVDRPGLDEILWDLTYANRWLAESNPRAHIRKRFNRAEAESERNPLVSDPLRLWGVAPTSSGFAGLVLSREVPDDPVQVQVAGLGSGIDRVAVSRRPSLRSSAATRAAMSSLAAGLGMRPEEIGERVAYAEVHDAFPIIEFLGLVDCGLVRPGDDPIESVRRGDFLPTGRLPVNLSGGVMGGHPLGATGIGQIVELYLQATDRSEILIHKQTPHYSLAFNVGGALTYNFVTLLAVTREPGEVGPFAFSLRAPFARGELDLSFEPTLAPGDDARVVSHTRLFVPPPGFETPWNIALLEGGSGAEFAIANGWAVAVGQRVTVDRAAGGEPALLPSGARPAA